MSAPTLTLLSPTEVVSERTEITTTSEAALPPAPITRPPSTSDLIPAVAVVAVLWWGQEVWIPLVVSVLISYALEPFIAGAVCRGVPRRFGVPVLMLLLISIVAGGAYLLRGEAAAFVERLPGAAHTVAEAVRGHDDGTLGPVAKVQEAARELESAASTTSAKPPIDGVTPVRIEEPTFRWADWMRQGSTSALAFVARMFAVLCLVYYMLAAGDLYKRKLVRIVPTLTNKKMTVEILADIDRQIERFLVARIGISVIVGVVIWITFRLFGLDEAGVWGVLSGVLFAIPLVGPTLVVVAAAVAAFVQFGSIGSAAAVGGVCLVIAALEGNILTPWLMSRVGEMNAIAVFVSLLFWGWLWGGWGLLLAVPITASIKSVCERVPDLSAWAELLKE